MREYNMALKREEEKLIREISSMKKFSFKKLLKCIELEALLNYENA